MLYLIAQNIRSLYNVGSLFRTADVFGVDSIILGGYTGFPPRKEITKTALGADAWIHWERHWHTHTIVKKLKDQGVTIVALESGIKNSMPLPEYKPTFPLAIIVGNEKNGISKTLLDLADHIVEIPLQGQKASLNVGIAAGVALYHMRHHNH